MVRFSNHERRTLCSCYSSLVELKSVEQISEAHKKQVQTYLRLRGYKLGFLLNFGEALMKRGIRVVNGLQDEKLFAP